MHYFYCYWLLISDRKLIGSSVHLHTTGFTYWFYWTLAAKGWIRQTFVLHPFNGLLRYIYKTEENYWQLVHANGISEFWKQIVRT